MSRQTGVLRIIFTCHVSKVDRNRPDEKKGNYYTTLHGTGIPEVIVLKMKTLLVLQIPNFLRSQMSEHP